MTNSHNRQQSGVRSAERYYTNASPQHNGGSGSNGNNSSHKKKGQKSPISMSSSQPLPITPPKYRQNQTNNRSSPGGFCYSSSPSSNNYYNNGNGGITVSHSPPNFSYYAGSKCYDSPAPTALPRPPTHWTLTCAQSAAQYNNKHDDFSHNLKIMLNVKA
jgi:hypothetical protein